MIPSDLNAAAFPKLDEAQMASLGRCPLTKLKRYRAGEKLFEAGDRDFKFFVVKSGEVEIVDESGETPKTIAVHGPGEFTGDVAQLTGSPALVSARRPGRLRSLRGVARRPAGAPQPPPGPGRHHPAGVHRPPAAPARVGQVHGPARDRLALLAGHLPGPRLPGQEPGAVHLAGPGGRPAGEAAARAVRGERGRHARGRLGPQAAPAQPLEPRAGGGPRPPPAAGADGLRPGRGRGRAGGAGRGGLRRLRGAEHGGAGAHGARRPGRPQHAHRELPRLPHRHHRRRAGGARRRAGQQVRGAACPSPTPGHAPDLRQRRTRCCTSTAARRSRPSAC